ncbi:MAG: hypothetical protein KatS3mg110_0892 [Pirellulaceae bacterium]|nr:MAG: hypothetical protein KatS3mg110_0892 [Pirellulaceae bacterium]
MVRERRRFFRIRAIGNVTAVLKLPQGTWSGQLLDHSASGFGAVFAGQLPVVQGQAGQLDALGAHFQVQVCRVEYRGGATILGLERLADLIGPEETQVLRTRGATFLTCAPRAVVRGMTWFGITVAALLAVAIWCSSWLIQHSRFALPELPASSFRQRESAGDNRAARPPQPHGQPDGALRIVPASERPPASDSLQRSMPVVVLGNEFHMAPEFGKLVVAKTRVVEFLASPDVARHLGLTREQQEKIARLVKQSADNLNSGAPPGENPDSWCLKTVQRAYDEVLAVLEPHQRDLLQRVLSYAGSP